MYDKLNIITYHFADVDLSAEGELSIPVPAGAQMARVMDVAASLSVATTGAPTTVAVGYSGDPYAYAALMVPAAAVGTVHNGRSTGSLFRGVYQADAGAGELSVLTVTVDGAAGAGTADLTIAVGFDHIAAD